MAYPSQKVQDDEATTDANDDVVDVDGAYEAGASVDGASVDGASVDGTDVIGDSESITIEAAADGANVTVDIVSPSIVSVGAVPRGLSVPMDSLLVLELFVKVMTIDAVTAPIAIDTKPRKI
jgi:hypothetical protein